MPRSAAKLLLPLAGLILAFQGYLAVRGVIQGWGRELPGLGLGHDLSLLAISVLVGRILLSWLPPGPQGSHTPRDLPLTLAVSFVLGLTVLDLQLAVLTAVLPESPPGTSSWLLGVGRLLLFFGPWLVLGLLRWLTLPGAMVPRHAPRRERGGPATYAIGAVGLAWAVTLVLASPALLIQHLGFFALWICVAHGLGQARRAPAGIAVVVVLGLSTRDIGILEPAVIAFGMGAAFTIGWLRRADRRACCLAAFSFASCAVLEAPTLALAGLATLVLASYQGQRRFAGNAALATALLIALPGFFGLRAESWFLGYHPWNPGRNDLFELFSVAFDPLAWGATWYLLAATLVAGVVARVRAGEVTREKLALLLLLALGFAAVLPLPWNWTRDGRAVLAFLAPVALLLTGLVWIPEEEPG